MSLQRSVRRDSIEYVRASYTADVNLTGLPVEIALHPPGVTAPVWLPATFLGVVASGGKWTAIAQTNAVVTFSAALYPRATYEVLVRLTDTPEVPILCAYLLSIDPT